MPVIGPTNPDYRFDRLRQLGQTGDWMLARMEAKRERQREDEERERLRAEQRFDVLAKTDPDAALKYGREMLNKLGPEGMEYIQNGIASLESARRTGRQFGERVGGYEQAQRQGMATAETAMGMPEFPTAGGQAGPTWQQQGQQVGQQAAGMNPLAEAYRSMPWQQRMAVTEALERQGIQLPEGIEPKPFDPYGEMQGALSARYAVGRGELPAWMAPSVEMATGERLRAGAEQQGELTRRAQEQRERNLEIQEKQRELAERKHQLNVRKEERLSKTGGEEKGEKKYWSEMEKDVAEYAEIRAEEREPEAERSERAKYRLTAFQVQSLQRGLREAVESGELERAEAEAIAQGVVDDFQDYVAEGMDRTEAWRLATTGGK